MRYLLYKELRLLTPLVLLLIVLQGMLLCFLGYNNSPYGHLPVFIAILSSVAFLLETEYGTMDGLLVQPVSRQRVWVVKIGAVFSLRTACGPL